MISRKRTIKRASIFRKSSKKSRKSSRKSGKKSRKSKSVPSLPNGYSRYAIQVLYNAKIYRSKKSLAHPLNKVKILLEDKGAKDIKLIYIFIYYASIIFH